MPRRGRKNCESAFFLFSPDRRRPQGAEIKNVAERLFFQIIERRSELPQADIPVMHFIHQVSVNLQRDDAFQWNLGVCFREVDGLYIIDPDANTGAFAANAIAVPRNGAEQGVAMTAPKNPVAKSAP